MKVQLACGARIVMVHQVLVPGPNAMRRRQVAMVELVGQNSGAPRVLVLRRIAAAAGVQMGYRNSHAPPRHLCHSFPGWGQICCGVRTLPAWLLRRSWPGNVLD
jgi:hypothetical protein